MVKSVCIPTRERGNEKPSETRKSLATVIPRSHAPAWECISDFDKAIKVIEQQGDKK
jgi:hypothetical protein